MPGFCILKHDAVCIKGLGTDNSQAVIIPQIKMLMIDL